MTASTTPASVHSLIHDRAVVLEKNFAKALAVKTDHVFALLMLVQWLGGIALAVCYSPRAWEGLQSYIHPHIWGGIFLGGVIATLPISLVILQPGKLSTRYTISCAQLLFSGLLIHLSGGRIETHFHIFGSLAFLSFYRDWRVLIPATIIVALDHALRGIFWPQSVFGVANASNWRWMEHAGWVIFEDIFLAWSCIRGAHEMSILATRQAELESMNAIVEAEVKRKTDELNVVTQELVSTARRAGMAEIATGVLHNVGNALNSVNVSANVALRAVKNSEIATLVKAGDLLRAHQTDLPAFLASDERGRQLPGFFIELADCLANEQASLVSELQVMESGLEHIKQIVGAQQQHAKNGTLLQTLSPDAVFEQAIAMSAAAVPNDSTRIVRNFEPIPPYPLDKHKILQILANLLTNARKAVAATERADGRIVVSLRTLSHPTEPRIVFEVSDNGMGIAPERLTLIFSHGYTTRADGHGFGLHSAANFSREMGGDLKVSSPGENQGATFTLMLPLHDRSDVERLAGGKDRTV